jgi:dTDP-glucose 4,6-dehydratase
MLNLVTGGAGFIGRELVSQLISMGQQVLVIDSLTYASKRENLPEEGDSFAFAKIDLCETENIAKAISASKEKLKWDTICVYHLAAESHVDRSINSGTPFMRSNVQGTQSLLEAVRSFNVQKFLHVSTDEVYGPVLEGESVEQDMMNPSSPYSASKAASELVVQAFSKTHGTPYSITRCVNNFGQFQHTEKLIPRLALNSFRGKDLPIFGDGSQIREWIHVSDHAEALIEVMRKSPSGQIYNIGSGIRITNLEIAQQVLRISESSSRVQFIEDRKAHDFRYALNSEKIKRELGWQASNRFSIENVVKQILSIYQSSRLHSDQEAEGQ